MLSIPLLQDTMAIGNELQGLKVKRLHVGGIPPSNDEVPQGLVGCIQVRINMRIRYGDSESVIRDLGCLGTSKSLSMRRDVVLQMQVFYDVRGDSLRDHGQDSLVGVIGAHCTRRARSGSGFRMF